MQPCPKDGKNMSPHRTARGHSIRCEGCSGLWLSNASVVRHIGAVPRAAYIRNTGANTGLHCPDDRASLVALIHHGVEIDICTQCGGVWLDRGELESILDQRRQGSRRAVEGAGEGAQGVLDGVDLSSDVLSSAVDFLGEFFSGL